MLPYLQLARFLLPLVVTLVVSGITPQALNGGIARGIHPTQTLAAFALAWGLADFLASPMAQVRQLALVLAEDRRSARQVLAFTLWCGAVLAAGVALLALTPVGRYVVEVLHDTGPELGSQVRFALLWLVPYPLLEGVERLLSGFLLRVRRTDVVSLASLVGIGVSLAAVFALWPTPMVRQRPLWLPILVTYAGLLASFAVMAWGHARFAAPRLPPRPGAVPAPGLTTGFLVRFFWPLALIMAIQGVTRPVVNLFVARGPDGVEALAALAVVYSLAQMPYGWLNELRNLPAAFHEEGEAGLQRIRRFATGCGLVSFAVMLVLFWVPAVRDLLLLGLLALPEEVAERCHVPLMLFSFFPLAVAPRSFFHGIALLQRRTRSLAPSAPARIGITAVAMVAVPADLWPGATRGVAALLAGFVLEAVVVWWCVARFRPQRPGPQLPAEGAGA